jgi:hypothetical protein
MPGRDEEDGGNLMSLQNGNSIHCIVEKTVIKGEKNINVLPSASNPATLLGTNEMESGFQKADVSLKHIRTEVVSGSRGSAVIHEYDGPPRGQ